MDFCKGQIVKSVAGHDKGSLMVILKTEGQYAYISDGKVRFIEKPKKKGLKHIKPTNTVIDLTKLTNRKLRNILKKIQSEPTVTN